MQTQVIFTTMSQRTIEIIDTKNDDCNTSCKHMKLVWKGFFGMNICIK